MVELTKVQLIKYALGLLTIEVNDISTKKIEIYPLNIIKNFILNK